MAEHQTPWIKERSLTWLLGVALLYGALVALSLQLSGSRNDVAMFWFANPVGTVALLASARNQWPRLVLVLLLTSVLGHVLFGVAHHPLLQVCIALASTSQMLLAAWLVARLRYQPDDLQSPSRLAILLVYGGLVPVFLGALAGALLLWALQGYPFAETAAAWFTASLVGTVATLPASLALWLRGSEALRLGMARPQTVPLLLLSAGATVAGAATLPHPFVVTIIPLMLLALNTNFVVTALAHAMTAFLLAALLRAGVLIVPPTSVWWGDMLYHGAILAALLPGLFLAASVQGRAASLREFALSEQRFRKLYTETPAIMHAADARGGVGGPILSVSKRWLQATGYREDEVVGHSFSDFLTPKTRQFAREVAIPQLVANGRCEDFEGELVARDGRVLDILFSAVIEYDELGEPQRSYAVLQDITEKKRLAVKSHFAEHDPLTGLPNRVLLQDRLERTCAHHERNGGAFAVGFLDLDHFKPINDQYGHEAGDYLLREVAQRLLAALRATDTVSRTGGDEFVLLFSQTEDMQDMQAVSDKLLQQVAQPLVLREVPGTPTVQVSASMGVAMYPQHGRDPQTLLHRADEAMYHSKRAGRNRCAVYRNPE